MRAYVCIKGKLGYSTVVMGSKQPTIHITDNLLQLYGVQGYDIMLLRQLKLHEAYADHAGNEWVCVDASEPHQAPEPVAPWEIANQTWS